jgi:putative heme iron utilization protein
MSSNAHGRPRDETPLTIGEPHAPTHGERARTLVGAETTGTLATLNSEGFPHGAYVTFALDGSDPVFLVSNLAAHTQNLENDTRASLLVHEIGATDPLSNGRVTLLGKCERLTDDASAREAFLAVHKQAEYYVDFSDFSFWRLAVQSVRYIGGYGRMSWPDLDGWRSAQCDPIAVHATGIIEHMNDDHADAMVCYARAFTRATEADDVVMTGIDRYGFELSVAVNDGRRPARIAFKEPIATATDARKTLVSLLGTARAQLDTKQTSSR